MEWAKIAGAVVAAVAGAGALWAAIRQRRQDEQIRDGAVAEHQVRVNQELDEVRKRARERREKILDTDMDVDDILDRYE